MSEKATDSHDDLPLARGIVTLMRLGTALAAILLSIGAVFICMSAETIAEVLFASGCTVLVLLPVIRLVMMVVYFARIDRILLLVSTLVLTLVLAGAAVGLGLSL